jgi:hypothetical protein
MMPAEAPWFRSPVVDPKASLRTVAVMKMEVACSDFATDSQRRADTRERAGDNGSFTAVMQEGDKDECVVDRDVDVDLWNPDRDARTDDGRGQQQQQEINVDDLARKCVSGVEATGGAGCHYGPHVNPC